MKLLRCIFCNQVLDKTELNNKDENGNWCNHCWNWQNTQTKEVNPWPSTTTK